MNRLCAPGSVLLLAAGAAGAGTISVTSTSGDHDVAASCVLRDAITTANTATPTGGCLIAEPPPPTSAGAMEPDCLCTANTITLPGGSTITLTEVDDTGTNTGLPVITASLTISGYGATIRRDPALGCNRDGIADAGEFALLYNSSPLLVLDHVTLSDGCADSADYTFAKGGAITNYGALVLQNVVLADNYASNRGGALYDDGFGAGAGSATISDSTISGNVSMTGGGIFVEGTSATVTITRSLFLQNAAAAGFGGGAIEVGLASSATILNSTFSQNSAGGGAAIEADGIVAMSSSTLAQNDSANGAAFQIATSGAGQQATIKNSLLAANTGGSGNCAFAIGAVTLAGVNLSPDDSCAGFALGSTDAKLLPLGDNGGPTWTYGLPPASPAVDAVSDCTDSHGFVISVDQRGFVRPVAILTPSAQCDIGAFELGDAIFGAGFDPPPSSA